jgi:CAP-Gly domain-containing linker protein 1
LYQETIALYEEKLNEADGKRWEMEDLVHDLEEKLRKQKRSISPATIARHASEATQIDNETLKEQVVHFERKVSQLESHLDGAREAAEREEQAMRVRIAKYKENDGALRKELSEARAEVDHRMRLEATGKARLEELEEALRENAVALENARAEIEGLRAELAVRTDPFSFNHIYIDIWCT